MRLVIITILAVLFLAAGCAPASPLEDMEPGEEGRVVRVIDGDALVLHTGQSVRLVGIEAPAPARRDRAGEPHAEESARMLEDLVMGRKVQLFYPGLTRDRYDRALAHVVTADGVGPDYWVNLELVRRGAARVRLYPDTDGGGETLVNEEARARLDQAGLWHSRAYTPMQAWEVEAGFRGFAIVEGVLGETAKRPEEERYRSILCSRRLEGADLIVDMTFTSRPACQTPAGTAVRVRGWTDEKRMELVHPLHLERLNED